MTGFGSMAGEDGAPPMGERPSRWPHEIVPDPVPDGRLPPLRSLETLSARKARLAEAALARARHAWSVAARALDDARQALDDQVAFVADERQRLLQERQASTEGGAALRRWREADQQLLDSIPPRRKAVVASQRALASAEQLLERAQLEQRRLARRHEKFDMMIEQIQEEA
ncbi:hypothetical protein SAMN05216359_10246 [Roseateles sp. YR242]|uniref:hypothetical protein n=1 Tax=Roseateles sp. YR242 TaxID=1855305 RepID=UPI0008BB92F6|nr:hypothetical protein [Roseateles sp. YR242]SEK51491.1 hypothetical protein SAMN05216359_10246 [Roseateles sp. YR242]